MKIKLNEVEIHELAHLTPTMTENEFEALKVSLLENGQEMPIVMYRGKCIDGRHRVKALRELGVDTVLAENIDSKMSLSDVRNKVIKVYETRRHQTPTQKAISAYREYIYQKTVGEKVNQGEVANSFGTTRKQLGRVGSLAKLVSEDIMDALFAGNKINIGSLERPCLTDSLDSLINHFQKMSDKTLELTRLSKVNEDFTDDEMATINEFLNKAQSQFSGRMLKRINEMLYLILSEEV